MSLSLPELFDLPLADLVERARSLGLDTPRHPWRDGLATAIAHHEGQSADLHFGVGVLEVHGEGFGFLRSPHDDLLPGAHDIYVSQSQIRRFELRTGDTVIGRIRPPKEQERYPALLRVELVNGEPADARVPPFEELTAVHPSTRLPLARDPWLSAVDWLAPLGLGQRGVIVGAPRAARTELLQRLARLFEGDDDIETTVLLLGARPEEIHEWRESSEVEVLATPMDEAAARHLQVADIAFERARRLAERGVEVVLIVDSLSRLLRFALSEGTAGREIEGVDAQALYRLRRWMATGRDLEDAGSVTLVATLNDDPSDPLSVALTRDLAEVVNWRLTLAGLHTPPGVRPAFDVDGSFNRREDLLVFGEELDRRRRWREALPSDPAGQAEALEALFRPNALDSGSGAGQ